jgi:hypothetical protein
MAAPAAPSPLLAAREAPVGFHVHFASGRKNPVTLREDVLHA